MQIQGILGACRAFGLKWHQLWTGGGSKNWQSSQECNYGHGLQNQHFRSEPAVKATAGTVDCKMVYVRGARFEPEAACAARF